ncbi:MAG TPA: hypothetical protein VJ818_08595 [Actinomycetota bacterium]|nr:hypothetical protein [Actinomycetota bacterium]
MRGSSLLDRALRGADVFDVPDDPRQSEIFEAFAQLGHDFHESLRLSQWGRFPVAGGADDGTVRVQNAPAAPFVYDPSTFFHRTAGTVFQRKNFAVNPGQPWAQVDLPQVGVIDRIILQFVGTLTVGVAASTSTPLWPYGLLENVQFTADGSTNLVNVRGIVLKELERIRYPGSINNNDDLIGPGIGGGLNLPVGVTNLRLTYEIPLSFDDAMMVGAVFAQSRQLSIALNGKDAAVTRIATAGGGGTQVIAGNWNVLVKTFKIPADNGKMILPDLRVLHSLVEIQQNIAGTGPQKQAFNRVGGSLQRAIVSDLQKNADPVVFYNPATAADVSEYDLIWGANEIPYAYNPAQALLSRNVRDYGDKLPYGAVCLDLARWNSLRDALNLSAITELYWQTIINTTAPDASGGTQYLTQESLIQAA